MANVVGEIVCGNCQDEVPLSKDARGKFYYHCRCGQHFMRGRDGADIVLSMAKIYGAEPVNVTEKTAPVASEKPVNVTKKRRGPVAPPEPEKPVNVTESQPVAEPESPLTLMG